MYRTSAVILATVAGIATAQSDLPTVTTPTSLVECQPAQITVSGGTAPYFLSIIPGGQAGAAALETLPTLDAAGAVTWNVDIAAGTSVTVQVRDNTGALNYSQQVSIQAGSSNSCVGGNASASSAATSAATAASSAASGATSVAESASSRASSAASSASAAVSSAISSAASAASSVRPSGSTASSARSSGSSAAPSASASASGASTLSASIFGLAAAFVVALFA